MMNNVDSVTHNTGILSGILTWKPKHRRTLEEWFRHIMAPTFRDPNGDPYLLHDPHTTEDQIGGSDHIYAHVYEGREYQVRIRDIAITDEHEDCRGKIFLMSPLDDHVNHYCLYAKIERSDPTTVELMDLILNHNCTNQPKTPPKIGRIYVHLMTQFIIEHHQELGVNRISLDDNAIYRCPLDRHMTLHLERTRQLEGDDPYYVQFGYTPQNEKSSRILLRNKRIMSHILTKDDKDLMSLCETLKGNPIINRYIQQHQNDPMSKTLKFISRTDCLFFSQIYRTLFEKYGLKELDSPLYFMNIM